MKRILFVLAFSASAVAAAGAQSLPIAPRWSGFAGCWEPVSVQGADAPATNPRICVLPTSDLGADLLSIVDHKVTEREHIDADGSRHAVTKQGCTGWESAMFSPSGRRIYFDSEQTCDRGVQRKTNGIFAVAENGQWTNIVDVSAGGSHGLRTTRYAPIHVDSTFPPEVVAAIGDREQSIAAGRIASRGPITLNEVIDASKALTPGVVDAWIASDPQRFELNANTLEHLADSGVKPSTIDVMVAVSNPNVFSVAANGQAAAQETVYPTNQRARANYDSCYGNPFDPWGYNDYGACGPYYGYGYFGYSPFYYGYPYAGYSPYSSYPYYYGGSSVVVVVKGSDATTRHGHMTKNGYTTQSTTSSGATSDRRPSSSGSSGGSSGSSGGSSTGRTAHAKPPESNEQTAPTYQPRDDTPRPTYQPRDDAASTSTPRTASAPSVSGGTATGRTAQAKPPAR
jgi:hypothetical protein